MLRLSVGHVLARSFSIWLRNIVPFTFLTLLVFIPLIGYTWYVLHNLTVSGLTTWGYVVGLGSALLEMVAAAAVIYAVVEQLRGNRVGFGKCLRVGVQRLLPVLVVGILAMVCIIAGLIALVIPGIIVALMLYVAVPVAVVERPGIVAALKRSAELTSSHKGTIFGILFLFGIIETVIQKIAEQIFMESITPESLKIYMYTLLGISIVLGGLGAVVNAVIYHDLRTIKEGLSIDELASVFD